MTDPLEATPAVVGRAPAPARRHEPANLADILERVLDKGIIIAGDIQVNLLDIELLTIKLRLIVASVDRAKEMGIDWWEHDPTLSSHSAELASRTAEMADVEEENRLLRQRISALEAGDDRERSRDAEEEAEEDEWDDRRVRRSREPPQEREPPEDEREGRRVRRSREPSEDDRDDRRVRRSREPSEDDRDDRRVRRSREPPEPPEDDRDDRRVRRSREPPRRQRGD